MFDSLFQSVANEMPVFSSTLAWRAAAAFFTAFILVLVCGERIINFLRKHQGKGQPIREDGPQSHLLTKKGTPTMGGLMILGSGILSTILWAHWNDPLVWVCILVLLVYGFVGFADDYVKVKFAAVFYGVGFCFGGFLSDAGTEPFQPDYSVF